MASSGGRPIPPAFDPTTRDTGPLSPRTGARAWDRDGNGAGAGSGSNLSSPALRKVSLNTTISRLSNAQVAPADIDTPKAGLPAVRAVSVLKRMSTKMPGSQTREGSMISDYYDKIQRADNRLSRAKEMQKVGYVLDPRYSKFVPRWDVTVLVALLYTAIVTPVEVAFLREGEYISPIFVIDRIVDVTFSIDICLSFFVAYQAKMDDGGHCT